jgi:hypothetical protein
MQCTAENDHSLVLVVTDKKRILKNLLTIAMQYLMGTTEQALLMAKLRPQEGQWTYTASGCFCLTYTCTAFSLPPIMSFLSHISQGILLKSPLNLNP